ncbi:MAG: hypothetical protein DYH20_05540 [Gammaproteobacteria bacterium PRO9]|nr:hypothetical protein [Gammaproteobacteria bacterium PRO9]
MTLRQLYYRAVATGKLDKTERDYDRLIEVMNRARRGGWIPFAALRDDGITRAGGQGFADRADALDYLQRFAAGVELDRQAGQPERLQIWCEAAGMVPQLQRVAEPYGVPVISSGGFDSVTCKHDMGRALAAEPATILHLGDHDPSGVHIFTSLAEDVTAFSTAFSDDPMGRMAAVFDDLPDLSPLDFVRLAVTPEQAEAHCLPSAPPKPTDRRRFSGMTWQCEALPPDVLANIVHDAILERLEPDTYNARLAEEQALRDELTARLVLDGAP